MAIYTRIKQRRLDQIRPLLELDILSEHVVLAGGSVSSIINTELPVNDYDIFFLKYQHLGAVSPVSSYQPVLDVKNKLEEQGYSLVFNCPAGHLYTYKKDGVKIQLITKNTYKDVNELLYTFDFVPCMCAYYNGELVIPLKQTIKCCKFKTLEVHYISYPTSSLRRLLKYHKKGFYPTNQCLKKIAYDINNTSLNDHNMAFYFD